MIPSSERPVVRDEPGRADFLFSSSLLWEAEQKDQQEEEANYFHDVSLKSYDLQATYTASPTHSLAMFNLKL